MDKTDLPPELQERALKQFPILQYFAFEHLVGLTAREVSRTHHRMAWYMVSIFYAGSEQAPQELAAGLRHLLEAKDCFVRSALTT